MVLPDVNILVYAFRPDATDHERYRDWLQDVVDGPAAFGCSDFVLSGFLRIVTHPRVFASPDSLEAASAFVSAVRDQPHCVPVSPGPRHWDLFLQLGRAVGAQGNLVPSAYLAALAIESGCEWITTDRDFARFPGLRWRYPLS
ncbi:MAG: type II toxin-antitoxin system VapC family toxin [Geodermatophilaceae bacterium]|nr:type II toxin-antitoxin system VapC family toxin [Geodermatophilaceae bacterium]